MTNRQWHAPQAVLAIVLLIAVIGTVIVGLLLGGSEEPMPAAATPESTPVVTGETAPASSDPASPPPSSAASGAAGRTAAAKEPADLGQRTLLLQVRDANGLVSNAILLATASADRTATAITLPPNLLVPTPQWTPLEFTASTADTLLSRNAVSMALGVRVDASLTLDRLALAALVDAIGGIPVEIDESVTVVKDSVVVVSIPAGSRVIDGVTAADYAMALPAQATERDRVQRFLVVLQRILQGLPTDQEGMGQLVLSLGSLAKSTATNDELVATLLDLRQAVSGGQLTVATVPATVVRGGGLLRPDPMLTGRLMGSLLPQALRIPGQSAGIRVVLRSAGATPGRMAEALAGLGSAGMTAIDAGRDSRTLPKSSVTVATASQSAQQVASDVAVALGLPASAIRIDPEARESPDVLVLLGQDAVTR